MRSPRVMVLKFGGSVLRSPADLPRAVHEIYRWVRDGWRVVAVVSAFAGETDAILRAARQFEAAENEEAIALLTSTGETRSAGQLALALDQAGVGCRLLDAAELQLMTTGSVLNAQPHSLNRGRLRSALARSPVVVVPGFVGRDRRGCTTLLGRGGSDYTAIFIAQQLSARCRLVKDVDGLYEWDPHRPGTRQPGTRQPGTRQPGTRPCRYRSIPWQHALTLDGSIVQHKAVAAAQVCGQSFEVSSLFRRDATVVGDRPIEYAIEPVVPTRLRVAVVGAGTVGRGVIARLGDMQDRFELATVAVRNRAAHADLPADLLCDSIDELRRRDIDVLIDASGSGSVLRDVAARHLSGGRHFITADKQLVATWGADLERAARRGGSRFAYSAAVGGAVPILESIRQIARRLTIVRIDAVLNGTTNYVLDRLRGGESITAALIAAQRAGLAEQDPSRDLDGLDAAHKLVLIGRAVSGDWLGIDRVEREAFDAASVDRLSANGRETVIRQIASIRFESHGPPAEVGPAAVGPAAVRFDHVPIDCPLGRCSGSWNVARIETACGRVRTIQGKGAGRWPTAESVIGDLLSIERTIEPSRRPGTRLPVTQPAIDVPESVA